MTQKIIHTTRYLFEAPVTYALQKVRLHPLSGPLQQVVSWDVSVQGGKLEASYKDHYGNHVDLLSADPGGQELVITAQGEVATNDGAGILGHVYGRAPLWHFRQQTRLTQADAPIKALAQIIPAGDSVLNGLHTLSGSILGALPYETGHTYSATTAVEALQIGKGVCQDHAHVFIAAARHAGLPARYVSGYLRMTDRIDQDASHAWAEVHVEDLGWVGFDVSNGIAPDTNYVRIAIGRDASDAAPVSGLRIGAGAEKMMVTLQVQQ